MKFNSIGELSDQLILVSATIVLLDGGAALPWKDYPAYLMKVANIAFIELGTGIIGIGQS